LKSYGFITSLKILCLGSFLFIGHLLLLFSLFLIFLMLLLSLFSEFLKFVIFVFCIILV
jgi:hypothetical protein